MAAMFTLLTNTFPCNVIPILHIWAVVQMALAANLTRAIGVSNYKAADLKALDMSGATPAVNQVNWL